MKLLVTSFLQSPNSLLSLTSRCSFQHPFITTFILWSFFNVKDQVSDPHKTTSKVAVLYILIFTFLDRNRVTSEKWLCYGLDNRGIVVRFPEGAKSLLLKRPDFLWEPTGLLHGLKQPGLEINPSRTPDTEIINVWSYTFIHPYVFLARYLKMTGTSSPSSYINSIETDNKKRCDCHVKS